MVMDHRNVRLAYRSLPILAVVFTALGCQSVVDPGRTMRPAPVPQGSNVIPPSGPAFPTNSIPPETSGIDRQPAAAVLSLPQADPAEAEYYTVKKGDSFSSIAAKHRLTVPQLTDANGIDPATVLQPGQMLYIPKQ